MASNFLSTFVDIACKADVSVTKTLRDLEAWRNFEMSTDMGQILETDFFLLFVATIGPLRTRFFDWIFLFTLHTHHTRPLND